MSADEPRLRQVRARRGKNFWDRVDGEGLPDSFSTLPLETPLRSEVGAALRLLGGLPLVSDLILQREMALEPISEG